MSTCNCLCETKTLHFDTKKYIIVNSNIGNIIVALSDISEHARGTKVSIEITNITSIAINKLTLYSFHDNKNKEDDTIKNAFELSEIFYPGVKTSSDFIIPNTKPTDINSLDIIFYVDEIKHIILN